MGLRGRTPEDIESQAGSCLFTDSREFAQALYESFEGWRDDLHSNSSKGLEKIGNSGNVHTVGELSHGLFAGLFGLS